MTQRTTVVGVFEDPRDAQLAIEELRQAGFREDQIGVASHQREKAQGPKVAPEERHAGTGAVTGALAGAGLGAAWSIAAIAGLIPAIGPVIAGGTLAAILAGAGLGAAAVGLAGTLIGLGIPEEEAHYYEKEFQSGRTIVTVKCDQRQAEALAIVRRHHAYDVNTRAGTAGRCETTPTSGAACTVAANVPSSTSAPRAAMPTTAPAGEALRLHEEELRAHKQTVQTGEVRVRKEVHTEHQTLDVPVRKEEVVIERRPVAGQASSADIRPGEDIRIPVSEEQVKVEKQTVAKEEVKVGKRQVQDTERVSGDVRKEEVRVEKTGDVDVNTRRPADKRK